MWSMSSVAAVSLLISEVNFHIYGPDIHPFSDRAIIYILGWQKPVHPTLASLMLVSTVMVDLQSRLYGSIFKGAALQIELAIVHGASFIEQVVLVTTMITVDDLQNSSS